VLADFTLSFAGSASGSGISGAGAITNVALDAGSYTISENAVEFYSGALACSGAADGDPSDGLDLAVGEVVTCTFTNTFNPIYDFTVTKSVSVGPTSSLGQSNTITDAGDQISYTIVISNIGNSGLTSFVLTESLPSTAIVCKRVVLLIRFYRLILIQMAVVMEILTIRYLQMLTVVDRPLQGTAAQRFR